MSKDEYLITDAPLKALTVFAMPMILGSFFQQVYNMADSIIVGQFVGSSALAAVGACAALTNVFICIALGAGVGAGVLVSRYFGARDYSKMKTIVSTSLISFLILSKMCIRDRYGFAAVMRRNLCEREIRLYRWPRQPACCIIQTKLRMRIIHRKK